MYRFHPGVKDCLKTKNISSQGETPPGGGRYKPSESENVFSKMFSKDMYSCYYLCEYSSL